VLHGTSRGASAVYSRSLFAAVLSFAVYLSLSYAQAGASTIRIPTDEPTIQAGIAVAREGDLWSPIFFYYDVYGAGGGSFEGSCSLFAGAYGNFSADPSFLKALTGTIT